MRFIYILVSFFVACAHATTAAAAPPPSYAPEQPSSQLPVTAQPWDVPELFDALNSRRSIEGAPALKLDRGLCAVAERAQSAHRRLGHGAETRVLALLNQDLEGFSLTFEHTKGAVVVVEELRDAPQLLRAAMDPTMAYAGITIGPAPPPTGPRGGYSVVLALGR